MQSLPIEQIHACFSEQLPDSHLVIEADTGSGKSTCLPLWARACGRVLVVEPRRIACTSLAGFLAEKEQSPLGEKVGYAIKLESHYDENTQVVFVTPGVALRWFAEDKLKSFDVVMVDEFHERRWDTDLLLALLLKHDQHRLIVTSATMEAQRLCDYTGARLLRAEGRLFDVAVSYRARDSRHLPDVRGIEQSVAAEVSLQLENTSGDILVFLPGKKEIQQCQSALKSAGVLVVPLHASVSDRERDLALNQQSQQKVVLATNVAETSLTIPNISVVIDSGLERRTQQRNGRTVLALRSISKASARQRSGRAGRLQDGCCIRLYGEHAALETVTPPELQREELCEAMLASASCGSELASLDFLDPLPEKSLLSARKTLETMQAIDGQGCITAHGKLLYPLPIDALYADLLTRLPGKALQEAMVDLSAALCVPARMYRLPSGEEARDQLNEWESAGCDAVTLVRLVRGDVPDVLTVEPGVLQEARALAAQMREVLSLPQLSVASRFDRSKLALEIARLHPELVFVRRAKRRDALGNGISEANVGRDSRFSDKAEAAVVLDQHSLPGRGVKQTLNLASVMVPLKLPDIESLGLGEWTLNDTACDDDGLKTREELVYAGRVIASREAEVTGTAALVQAVKSNQVWPGFAEQREQDIAAWKLFCELDMADGVQPDPGLSFESWFGTQLEALGVESVDDLELFSPEDMSFEGIPDWQRSEFDERYPTRLWLGELVLDVEYFPKRKLVHVVYHSGIRKKDPKRIELPRFNGWRVQYRKASRVIDIR